MDWCCPETWWTTNYTSQQDFVPRKVYCASNVTFHAESKYAIKFFHHPQLLYNGIFYYWFFEILAIFFSYFFLHEQIFYIVLNIGWSHTVYHYQITSCICSEAGSEWDKRRFMAPGILLSRSVALQYCTFNLAVTKKNRRWWRKTAYIFEFSVKSSIGNRHFPPCAKEKLNFVFQCYRSTSHNIPEEQASHLHHNGNLKPDAKLSGCLAQLTAVLWTGN
jgi:hypothetical protein